MSNMNQDQTLDERKLRVVIAGATGFIGKALIERLMQREDIGKIIGLTRGNPADEVSNEKLEWQQADLFSLLDSEKALEGADVAYYLVHSMSPTAALDQGSFEDYDLILSDNFARAASKHNLKQIIYLGGITPENSELSPHLKSRQEVERTLQGFGNTLTTLRAGMIVGAKGSSFNILLKLVDKVPTMLVPSWALIQTQTIDIENVIDALAHCLNNPFTFNQTFDIGGPDTLTYKTLLEQTAQALGKKRWFIPMPLLRPWMVRRWLCFIADAPKALVYPLVRSLNHSIMVRPGHVLVVPNSRPIPFIESVKKAIASGALKNRPHAYVASKEIEKRHEVRSVQRMLLPKNMKADAVSFAYQHWLPRFMWPFLSVKKSSNKVAFHIWGLKKPLLLLELSYQRSTPDRQLLYIVGGMLATETKKGRLEFREVLNGQYLIAAIHNFKPAMPWWLYVNTQAPVHLFVMNSFNGWLKKQDKSATKTIALNEVPGARTMAAK